MTRPPQFEIGLMKAADVPFHIKGSPIPSVVKVFKTSPEGHPCVAVAGKRVEVFWENSAETFKCDEVFGENATLKEVHYRHTASYVNSWIDGFNVCGLILVGSARVRRLVAGTGPEDRRGLPMVDLVGDLIRKMDLKSSKMTEEGNSLSWTARFSAVEIIDEKIHDLFSDFSPRVEEDPWLGVCMTGVTEHSLTSVQGFEQMLGEATAARSAFKAHFGPSAERSFCVYNFNLIQKTADDQHFTFSKFTFVEFPALEVLLDDPEDLRAADGPTFNKGVLAVHRLLVRARDFSEALRHQTRQAGASPATLEPFLFDGSHETNLLKGVILGPTKAFSLCLVDAEDERGSLAVLKLAKILRKVVTFPVVSSGNFLGSGHLWRVELLRLRNLSSRPIGGNKDSLDNLPDIGHLENDAEKLKLVQENRILQDKLAETKEKLAEAVKKKLSLGNDLLKSEKERVKIAGNLAAATARQSISSPGTTATTLQGFSEAPRMRQTHPQAAPPDLQEKLEYVLAAGDHEIRTKCAALMEDNRDLQQELEVVRRNYQELVTLKARGDARCQAIELELINTVNEKKRLEAVVAGLGGSKDTAPMAPDRAVKSRQGAFKPPTEEGRVGTQKPDLASTETIPREHSRLQEVANQTIEKLKREVWDLKQSVSSLTQQLSDERLRSQELRAELAECRNLEGNWEIRMDQLRQGFRSKLEAIRAAGNGKGVALPTEELIKSYLEREKELLYRMDTYKERLKTQEEKNRELKDQLDQTRQLAVNWAPPGYPLPPVLLKIKSVSGLGGPELRPDKTLSENWDRNHLPRIPSRQLPPPKPSPGSQRPGYPATETEQLFSLQEENERLRQKILRLEQQLPGRMGPSSDASLLKKIGLLETKLVQLEEERAELISRLASAELRLRSVPSGGRLGSQASGSLASGPVI